MKQLTPEEFKFVTELLNGATVEQAGEAVGIKRRAAFQWKGKEHIQAAIEAAKQGQLKVVEEYRAERVRVVMPAISERLKMEAVNAIEVIVDIMNSGGKEDMVRLQAAKEVIRLSGIVESQQITKTNEQSLPQQGLSSQQAIDIRANILGVEKESEKDKPA
jgi:hypothetical protein